MESFNRSSLSRPIHVYLSFKGDDETCRFTDMLWAALETDNLNTFWDDKKLDPGDFIFLPRHFLKAIRHSNISIVVFSKNYASSIWCLEELSEIASRIHEPRYTVFPIFYDVHTSEVRNQLNCFGKAFAQYEQRFAANLRKVHSWRLAIKQVANLSGWHVPYDPWPQVIDDIVREVKKKVRELVYVDADLVGMQSPVREVEELLDLGSNDEIRVVGICGMGGIGKTTLARVVYDRISHHFDASYFIVNEDELHIVLGKKILLVLDDVNIFDLPPSSTLLSALRNLLVGGSRIIITTRDEGVLRRFQKHDIYRAKLLTRDEALQLFCRKAFRCDFPVRGYDEGLINRALEYASGLPLAIVKLGSFLYNTRPSEWSTALVEFKRVASFMVMKVLKRSLRELDFIVKETFVDIACFFIGKESKFVEGVLDSAHSLYYYRDLGVKHDMQLLIEKSLMAIIDKKIQMHGLLQEMGRDVVRHKSPSKPEEWSRLWDFNDINGVMQNDTPKVEAIVLELEDSKEMALRVQALSHMINLRLLIFRNVKFRGALKHLSNKLRYISWHQYPFTCLPSSFVPHDLIELILPDSSIANIWEGDHPQPFPVESTCLGISDRRHEYMTFPLRNMNLSGSKNLIKMPDFKRFPELERLELEGCTELSRLDGSVAYLSDLKFLSLRNCTNLVSIPNQLFSLPSLEVLNVAGCSKFAYCLKFCPFEELGDRETIEQSFSRKRQKLRRQKSI